MRLVSVFLWQLTYYYYFLFFISASISIIKSYSRYIVEYSDMKYYCAKHELIRYSVVISERSAHNHGLF